MMNAKADVKGQIDRTKRRPVGMVSLPVLSQAASAQEPAAFEHPQSFALAAPVARGELRLGHSSVNITPPKGIPLAGYYEERGSHGTADELFAKAAVMNDGWTKVAFVVCGLLGIPHTTTEPEGQPAGAPSLQLRPRPDPSFERLPGGPTSSSQERKPNAGSVKCRQSWNLRWG
jgi:hypothetical protein